jgi:hypothetical protein
MILWSKGLGKLVLNLRLSERSGTSARGETFVVDGTMGPPTFWNYAVTLNEEDVVDFISLLRQPAPTRFLVATPKRWAILETALAGLAFFLWRTLYRFFGGRAVASSAGTDEGAAGELRSGSDHDGS